MPESHIDLSTLPTKRPILAFPMLYFCLQYPTSNAQHLSAVLVSLMNISTPGQPTSSDASIWAPVGPLPGFSFLGMHRVVHGTENAVETWYILEDEMWKNEITAWLNFLKS